MEEDALQDAWNLSLAKGFKGSKEDFTKLLQSNNDFFNLSFNTFKEKDFDGDEEAYSNLLGIQRPQPSEESVAKPSVSNNQSEQPSEGERTPEYLVNGKPFSKKQIEKQLSNPKFIEKVKSGEFDVTINNDQELGMLLNPNLATTSDGKYSVDISGTILFPKTGGQPEQTTFQELVEISRGDTDAAIKMFANRSEMDRVAKSPSKERVKEMLEEPVSTQEEISQEFAVRYSAGSLYNDYTDKNVRLDSIYSEVNRLEALDTPPQEEIKNLKTEARNVAEQVKEAADNIVRPVVSKNIGKYFNEDNTPKDEWVTENYYGFPQVDVDKIRETLPKNPDEFIVDENLRTKYISDISNIIQGRIDAPEALREERRDKIFKEKNGQSFDEQIDADAKKAFNERYADPLKNIADSYRTKVDSVASEIAVDYRNYSDSLKTEFDKISNDYNSQIATIQEEANNVTSGEDLKVLQSEADKLTSDYNKKVDAYIRQDAEYIAEENSRANELNKQFYTESKQQTDALSKEFSETYKVPQNLIEDYQEAYNKATQELIVKNNKDKKVVIQYETDIPLGRAATSTLSSLGGSLYAITKAYGGEFPELKRMEQYFQPGVDPIKGFSDLNLYNIQESAGQLLGSMAPSIAASIATAVATKNLSTAARMYAVGGVGYVVETSDLSGRAYQTALEETGSTAIAKNAATETIDSQLLFAPTYLLSSLPFIGGLSKIANRPLRMLAGGTVEFGTEGLLQELPQQISEESIQKYGEFERALEFLTPEKAEEVLANVAPVFGVGAAGSFNADPANKLKSIVEKYPELARQHLIDITYKNGKEESALYLATLHSNGAINIETAENLYEFVESIDLNNTQEYTALKAKKDDLVFLQENEKDEVKKKVIGKQIAEIDTQLENILEGKETNVTQTTVGGSDYFVTASEVENTDKQQDLEDVQKSIDEAEGKPVEEAPLVTDESGEVVTVYRGGKSASGVQYYTSDRKLAESIGEAKGEGVQKATVRMANPWTPESLDVNNAPQWMQDWVRSQEEFTTVDEETMAAEEIPMEQAIQEIKDMQLSFRDVGLWQSFVNEALEHHDGIIAFDPSEDMAADKKIYITRSPEQVIRQEDAIQERETAEVPVGEEARISEEVDEEVREQATPEQKVAAAKQNLQDAWTKWKDQQRNVGIAFDPRSRAEEDVVLTRAVIDYLKVIGAKTIEDIKAAVETLSGFTVNTEDAKYLLGSARMENIREKIEEGITNQEPYANIEKALVADGYNAEEVKKRYNAKLREKAPINQRLQEYQQNFSEARRTTRDKGKLKDRAKNNIKNFVAALFDPKLKAKRVLSKLGMQPVLDRLQSLYGSTGTANFRFSKAYEKIYKGLSVKDTELLDQLIQLERFVAIDKDRKSKGLPKPDHSDFRTGEEAQKLIFGLQNKIGQAKFLDLSLRKDAYFNEFRKTLDKFQEAGLISKELRDDLYDINYQPRKFLQFLVDADKRKMSSEEKSFGTGVRQEVIQKLGKGDDSQLFSNSEWLLSTAINQAEYAIAYNKFGVNLAKELSNLKGKYEAARKKTKKTRADKKLIETYKQLDDIMINNPVRFDNGKLLFNKPPKGFSVFRYKKNGVENQIFMKDSFYESLTNIGAQGLINPKFLDFLGLITGAKLLRTTATGINPGFVLGNLPRDFQFALTFEEAYSNILPIAMKELSSDMVKAWASIQTEDQTFIDFVEYGGMMDYLYTMGALDEKSSTDKFFDKAFGLFSDEKLGKETKEALGDTATYLNKMSELGIRVGVYSRVFNQEMEKINKQSFDSPQERQDAVEDAKYHAVARARNLIDFSQGGSVIKTMNQVMPYLNAGFQSTYSAGNAIYKNPVRFALITAQSMGAYIAAFGAIALGLITALKSDDDEDKTAGQIYYETLDNISTYTKKKYFVIPNGVKDKNGNYGYIKIAKTQNLTPFFLTAEYYMNKVGREIVGVEPEDEELFLKNLVETITDDVDPTGAFNPYNYAGGAKEIFVPLINRNPGLSALTVLTTGYDAYRKKSVDTYDGFPELSGYDNPNIEDFYKDLAEITGDSPARLKVATEKIITNPSTNPFIGGFYSTLDVAVGNKEATEILTAPVEGFIKSMKNRAVGTTSPYVKNFERDKVLNEKLLEIEKQEQKIETESKKLIRKYQAGEIKKSDFRKQAIELSKKVDPEDQKSFLEDIQKRLNNPNIPPVYFSVAYGSMYKGSPEKQALKIVDHFGADILQNADNYYKMKSNFDKIGFKISNELKLEILRIVDQKGADELIKNLTEPPKKKKRIFVGRAI